MPGQAQPRLGADGVLTATRCPSRPPTTATFWAAWLQVRLQPHLHKPEHLVAPPLIKGLAVLFQHKRLAGDAGAGLKVRLQPGLEPSEGQGGQDVTIQTGPESGAACRLAMHA